MLAGLAALYWVGVPLKEMLTEAIDDMSTSLTDALEDSGFIQTPANRAEQLGEMIIREQELQQELNDKTKLYCNPALVESFNLNKCKSTQAKLFASVDRQEKYTKELDDIATGKAFEGESGWATFWKTINTSPKKDDEGTETEGGGSSWSGQRYPSGRPMR